MLFREIFPSFQTTLDDDDDDASRNSELTPSSFSLALHSRHTVVGDTGEFVQQEIDCLTELLPATRSLETCTVYLMSDRSTTVQLLTDWLFKHDCMAVAADSSSSSGGNDESSLRRTFVTEHGERAGAGFLQDLSLCSQARTGVIGDPQRSSFMLLEELIAYDRQIEAWRRNDNRRQRRLTSSFERVPPFEPMKMPPLLQCKLNARNPSGYSYGPGTPTFQGRSHQTPFEPISVLQQYREWHSVEALQRRPANRRYAVAHFPKQQHCSTVADIVDRLHIFFNRKFNYATLVERSLSLP